MKEFRGLAATEHRPRELDQAVAETPVPPREAAPLVRFALLAGDLLDAMAGDGIEIEGENDPAVVLGELMEAIRPGSEWHEARAIIRSLAKEATNGQ